MIPEAGPDEPGRFPGPLARAFARLLALPIHLYRWLLSPLLPPACRYHPSCSAYALEALALHGSLRGSWLTLARLARCQPWGGHGLDAVPPPAPRARPAPPAAPPPART